MFRTVPLSIIRSFFTVHTAMVYVIQVCWQLASRNRTELQFRPDPAPDDGQRNCPKHVEFYSKHKFEKLVHLFDFIIRSTRDALLSQFRVLFVGDSQSLLSHSRCASTLARTDKNFPVFYPLPYHMPICPSAWSSVALGGAILRRYVIWPKPFACKKTNSRGSCKRIIHFYRLWVCLYKPAE